jgi:hypothetical protein
MHFALRKLQVAAVTHDSGYIYIGEQASTSCYLFFLFWKHYLLYLALLPSVMNHAGLICFGASIGVIEAHVS